MNSTPLVRLQALQITSEAENKLMKVMLNHYEDVIPKLEADFIEIYTNMSKINEEKIILINLKLTRYKNEVLRQQKERREKKSNSRNQGTAKKRGAAIFLHSNADLPMGATATEDRPQRKRKRSREKQREPVSVSNISQNKTEQKSLS